jgi:hypothetical protein
MINSKKYLRDIESRKEANPTSLENGIMHEL